MTDLTKPRVRRTEFESLLRCGNWQNDGGELAIFGTNVHSAIEAWLRVCDAQQEAVEPVLAMVPHRDPEVFALLQKFAESHDPNLSTLHGTEVMLESETDLAILYGTLDRLDRWDGYALVTDWKSGHHSMDHPFQKRWYGFLVVANFPEVQEVVTRIDHIRLTEGVIEETFTRAELAEWWGDEVVPYIPLVLQRRANGGDPEGGSACKFCRLRLTCADSIAPYRDIPRDDEQARTMVAELVRHQAAAKVREEALRAYLEDRDALTANGVTAGFVAPSKAYSETVNRERAKAAGAYDVVPASHRWSVKGV